MRSHFFAITLSLIFMIPVCRAENPVLNYKRLNKQAAKEYLVPIRPGYAGRNPFWNVYAKKFIYAPAFDFKAIDGSIQYRFTATSAKYPERSISFMADTPTSALSPIWSKLPVGKTTLIVEGVDRNGKTTGVAGKRVFYRDYPFEGPYRTPALGYRESALMGMLYVHKMPQIQHWKENLEPDMTYSHNTYANKIIGATICLECLLAKEIPELREEAVIIAENAARFLIDQSFPEGHPLEFFPPTYYKNLIASKRSWNVGKTMTMDALRPATAFLDLYDLTEKRLYFEKALAIAHTYLKLQREDGSFPTKVDITTGTPVNNASAMLHPIVRFLRRLDQQYGITEYREMQYRCEQWMQRVAIETFDLEAQFEDINILNLNPYQNLTNCTAAPYASLLLTKQNPDDEEVADAIDLIRLSEDQFTHWNVTPRKDGLRHEWTPNVHEQYRYETAVVSSVCNVANAFLDLYHYNGDKLAFAKAKALIDGISNMQYKTTGFIPTTYTYDPNRSPVSFWINCTFSAVNTLLRMSELVEETE